MAYITIKISTANSAFDHAPHVEISRLLYQIARRFDESRGRIDEIDMQLYDWKKQWCGEVQVVDD
jgi:hypothetical protein